MVAHRCQSKKKIKKKKERKEKNEKIFFRKKPHNMAHECQIWYLVTRLYIE